MSLVTGVVLLCSGSDADAAYPPGSVSRVAQVNAWLVERGFGELVETSSHAGGTKHPQINVWAAGYNYFGTTPEPFPYFTRDDFAAFVIALPWEFGEYVVLALNPENGPLEVHRVPEARWSYSW